MEILNLFSPDQVKVFILILIRVSVILLLLPIFSTSMWPSLGKLGLCLVLTIVLFPIVPVDPKIFPSNLVDIGILGVSELLTGMVLSLPINIFFGATQLAGQVIGVQMGFSMINVVDPQSGENVSIMEQLGHWIVLLVFLGMNGHHIMLSALVESFSILDVGFFVIKQELFDKIIGLSTDLFIIGIKIGAPAMAALFFVHIAFGIIAKFAPQMNILIVAFPVQITVGLYLFGISLHIIAYVTGKYIIDFKTLLISILVWTSGG